MAASFNQVTLMGNLTRDPVKKTAPSGDSVCDLGLAVSERFTSKKTGEAAEVVTFVDITVWGKQADACAQYLTKGRPLFVQGRLVLDQWTDKETGKPRSHLRVRADRVQFLYAPPPKAAPSGSMEGAGWTPAAATPSSSAQPRQPATDEPDDGMPF